MDALVRKLFDRVNWETSPFGSDPLYASRDELREMAVFTDLVFSEISEVADGFSERQVVEGLKYVISVHHGGHVRCLISNKVPWSIREAAFFSMTNVFRFVFAPVCKGDVLASQMDENSYEQLCCYWWEYFPLSNAMRRADGSLVDAIFGVLENTLSIDNRACQRSAIRGLMEALHWHEERASRILVAASKKGIDLVCE